MVKKNLNPVWENFKIASSAIGHDKKAEIKVEVRDYDLLSKDDYMGTGYFKISKIVGGVAKKVELCNEDTGGGGLEWGQAICHRARCHLILPSVLHQARHIFLRTVM